MGVKVIFLGIIAVGLYYLFTRPTIEGMMMEEKKKETAVMNMEGMMPKMEDMMPKMEDMLEKMEGMMEPKKEGYSPGRGPVRRADKPGVVWRKN